MPTCQTVSNTMIFSSEAHPVVSNEGKTQEVHTYLLAYCLTQLADIHQKSTKHSSILTDYDPTQIPSSPSQPDPGFDPSVPTTYEEALKKLEEMMNWIQNNPSNFNGIKELFQYLANLNKAISTGTLPMTALDTTTLNAILSDTKVGGVPFSQFLIATLAQAEYYSDPSQDIGTLITDLQVFMRTLADDLKPPAQGIQFFQNLYSAASNPKPFYIIDPTTGQPTQYSIDDWVKDHFVSGKGKTWQDSTGATQYPQTMAAWMLYKVADLGKFFSDASMSSDWIKNFYTQFSAWGQATHSSNGDSFIMWEIGTLFPMFALDQERNIGSFQAIEQFLSELNEGLSKVINELMALSKESPIQQKDLITLFQDMKYLSDKIQNSPILSPSLKASLASAFNQILSVRGSYDTLLKEFNDAMQPGASFTTFIADFTKVFPDPSTATPAGLAQWTQIINGISSAATGVSDQSSVVTTEITAATNDANSNFSVLKALFDAINKLLETFAQAKSS